MRDQELLKRIVIDHDVMVGKPIIKGTRLTVQYILGLLSQGLSVEEIVAEYKKLQREDILACLAFAQHALESTTFAPLSL